MQVHFFAAARAAAGLAETTVETSALATPTVEALLAFLSQNFTGTTPSGQTLADILPQCSFLIDGQASETTASVADALRVDVLPPFAGG